MKRIFKIFKKEKQTARKPGSPSPVEMVPITQFSQDDIFIVAYPRSGITWFQNLVAGIYYRRNPEHTRHSVICDLVPDVHMKTRYQRYEATVFFKSHHLPRPEYRNVVYLVRDGRDVMVSCYHYYSAVQGIEMDFLKMVRDKNLAFGKWHQHVEAWLSNPYQARMLVIQYEALARNPLHELKRFCAFAGIERDDAELSAVARQASFDNLRRKETRYGIECPGWPEDKMFFRRGAIGSYKDEMPADVLKEFFCEASDTLRKLGYIGNSK